MRFAQVFLLTGSLFLTNSLEAFVVGPVSRGMGDAGVAASSHKSESIFANPATVAFGPKMSNGVFYLSGYDNNLIDRFWAFTGADHKRKLPGALGLVRRTLKSDTATLNEQVWNLSLGHILAPGLSVGYSFLRSKRSILSHENNAEEVGPRNKVYWDGNAGLYYVAKKTFSVALVREGVRGGITEGLPAFQKTKKWVAGFEYRPSPFFLIRADGSRADIFKGDDWVLGGGFEVKANSTFTFRGGYKKDQLQQKMYFTGGVGIQGQSYFLDYSLRRDSASKLLTHSLSFRALR